MAALPRGRADPANELIMTSQLEPKTLEPAVAITKHPLQIIDSICIAALLTGFGLICFRLKFWLLDLDVWWHIRVGDWIVEHHKFPLTGVFSRTAGDRPWIAYSWLYEVLVSRAYAWFGVVGVGAFETLLTLLVAYAVCWMVRRLSGRLWLSWLLATAAFAGFLVPAFALRCCSMALFAVCVTLLLESNRTGNIRLLYWLPPLFLVWSNLHIQFIYGIAIVGLFVAVNFGERLASSYGFLPAVVRPPSLPAKRLGLVFVVCVWATCIGPYSYHLYLVIFAYAKAKAPYSIISELQALDFRHVGHYVVLLLAGTAFVAIGWKKQIDVFQLALLTVATLVSFRTTRDAWFVGVAAIACIAESSRGEEVREPTRSLATNLAAAAITLSSLWMLGPSLGFNAAGLDRAVRKELPLNAVDFLREHPHPGPLYNTFDWGGFLILYLPEYPVAIDNRTDLYGDQMDEQFLLTSRGVNYREDPYLNQSHLVLLQKKNILGRFLGTDPRFRLIYQDDAAEVFGRR